MHSPIISARCCVNFTKSRTFFVFIGFNYRWGVRTQDLAKAIEQCLHPMSRTDANWAAGLTVAFCGLLRGAEFSLQEGETFNPLRHLTRADVKFFSKEGVEYAILRMRPGRVQVLERRHGIEQRCEGRVHRRSAEVALVSARMRGPW